MPTPAAPTALTTMLFVVLEALTLALWARGLYWANCSGPGPKSPATFRAGLALALVGWIAIPNALALLGTLDRWTMPPPALVMIASLTVLTVVLSFSRFGERLARLPLAGLVGFQVFRIGVEVLLHRLYREGVVPEQMTYEGLNLDIVTGLTAAVVGLAAGSRPGTRRLVMVWNVIGLLLLANIVVVAALSTPTSLRIFMEGPANRLPALPVFVTLPTFFVQVALMGHLVTFRALARFPRGTEASEGASA